MRILLITNTFPPTYTGGAEVSNYNVCRELMRRGHECSILFVNNRLQQASNEWYEYDGIPVHRVNFLTPRRRPITDVFDRRIFSAVRREIRRLTPDVVHMTNMSGATLAPYVACRVEGVPVVNTLHDLWLLCPNNMLYRTDGSLCDPAQGRGYCQSCFRRYDYWGAIPYRRSVFAALTSNVRLFIAPSQALIARHVEAGYRADRFRHVPHGLPAPDPYEPTYPTIREGIGVSRQNPTLVYAGGGVEIKGVEVLLGAIPAILSHIPGMRILSAGVGEHHYLTRLRDFTPQVQVLGWLPFREIHALYGAADLVVVPSTCHEAFSLVTLESMQMGTPVVGSNFGGIAELIRDGENGYLFSVGDAAALAERVIEHFTRPSWQRRRMRLACFKEAHTTYSLERQIDGILAVYHEAAGKT